MYKFLAGMIVMAALAAFVSKPSPEDAESELRNQIIQAVADQKLSKTSGLDTAALLACRLEPSGCADLLRKGIKMRYDDRILYARLDLDGFGMTASCYGLFTRFFCPGGLQET